MGEDGIAAEAVAMQADVCERYARVMTNGLVEVTDISRNFTTEE